jgi:hypothetical protein
LPESLEKKGFGKEGNESFTTGVDSSSVRGLPYGLRHPSFAGRVALQRRSS